MAPARVNQDEEYDYIVCGGGTSGSVVAGRLAEDPNVRILVLEAGVDSADLENVHMAGGWSQNFDAPTDWNIETVPAYGLGGRSIKASRGKFLGGSSGVNGMLCIRGTKQDYDDWGLDGWSGEEVFGYMKKAETFHGDDEFKEAKGYHGFSGPLHTEPHTLAPISKLLLESMDDQGLPSVPDLFSTGEAANGSGNTVRTVYNGIRTTGADFITKDYHRSNITIKTEMTVDKILFESSSSGGKPRAHAVETLNASGERETFSASKEIILSSGSYCSPAILLRSGIGPAKELAAINIDTIVDSPGVGKNLQDHMIVFIFYEVKDAGLTNDYQVYHGDAFAATYKQWKEEKKGFLAKFPFGAFAYARLDERLKDEPLWKNAQRKEGRDPMGLAPNQPNVEFFSTECYGGPKQLIDFPVDNKHCFSIIAELFSPHSHGTVTIKSSDPMEIPVVDHRYLEDPLDMLVLSEACRFANEIVIKGKGTKDVVKGSWPEKLTHHAYTKREEWEPYVRENATTCYHPGGTCKMGLPDDPMAVLDERLRVRGVEGLRVADVSVMPRLNQGHTQMPAYAIGEKCADMLKEDAR
ncbi:GMC oxidoreductase [Aulographum hederae CBS 113979]|uniref:GMC oxidoreductase n=1 Tax=Aulographum hederae CBS 113979 TaxID=1176131 RepID=A0A6G1H9W0_9PEZI|nr:GMC oxidoreductase [Aulographum hederae CBS 113979]